MSQGQNLIQTAYLRATRLDLIMSWQVVEPKGRLVNYITGRLGLV